MARRSLNAAALPRPVKELLIGMGSAVRIARLRRRKTLEELAAGMMVSVPTVRKIEHGDPSVAMGAYFSALWVLGLLNNARPLANPASDEPGLLLDLERLPQRVRKGRAHASR
jgi:transcriptional regulator with XRE-family HTH domain